MTNEIIIRPWVKEDAAQLAFIANNRKIWLNVRDRFPHPYTVGDALQWIDFANKQQPTQSLAIMYNGNLTGSAGIMLKDDISKKNIEIGYFVGETFWGKGIATKAVALLVQYIQQEFDVERVFAEVFETNIASMKVLQKNGFYLEAVRKKAVFKNNILLNDHVYVKLVRQ